MRLLQRRVGRALCIYTVRVESDRPEERRNLDYFEQVRTSHKVVYLFEVCWKTIIGKTLLGGIKALNLDKAKKKKLVNNPTDSGACRGAATITHAATQVVTAGTRATSSSRQYPTCIHYG